MSRENLSPHVLNRLARELRSMHANPQAGMRVIVNEADLADVQCDIEGPASTPYEGGVFRCKLVIGCEFPAAPPRGVFLTKIFHPNVSSVGDICVNTLKKDWNPELGLMHILLTIRCLLIVPFPESALNEEASKLFIESYDEYSRRAKMLTTIHASPSAPVPAAAPIPVVVKVADTNHNSSKPAVRSALKRL
jgi:ubiquitin-conjugating enzyme E2 S